MTSPVSPISVLSAVLLAGLLAAFGAFASFVVPQLGELLRTEPRLAMLGFLGVALSPAVAITLAHHLGSGILGGIDKATPRGRRGQSLSAGAHGWLVLLGASLLTNLVLLIITPPKLEPEAFGLSSIVSGLSVAQSLGLPSVIWVTIATLLFELQRRGQRSC